MSEKRTIHNNFPPIGWIKYSIGHWNQGYWYGPQYTDTYNPNEIENVPIDRCKDIPLKQLK